jgi:hypothetical protein
MVSPISFAVLLDLPQNYKGRALSYIFLKSNSLQLTHTAIQSSTPPCILSQIHSRPCFSALIFNSTHSYTQTLITIYNKIFCPLFNIVSYLGQLRLKYSVSRCRSEISFKCLSVSSGNFVTPPLCRTYVYAFSTLLLPLSLSS